MAITFDQISATIETPAATTTLVPPPVAAPMPPDHDRRRLDELLRLQQERLARVHVD